MREIENSPSSHIDRNFQASDPRRGRLAEDIFMNFYRRILPIMELKKTAPQEDAGPTGFGPAKAIDAVGYLEGKPAIAFQITSSSESQFKKYRDRKLELLKKSPYIRLDEMQREDVAIPVAIGVVELSVLKDFETKQTLPHNPELGAGMLNSAIASLRFDLTQTKNSREIQHTQRLLILLENKKTEISQKEMRV